MASTSLLKDMVVAADATTARLTRNMHGMRSTARLGSGLPLKGWRWLAGTVWLALCSALLAPGCAQAQANPPQQPPPDYRFRALPGSSSVPLNPGVLSDEERVFISALPELRVAVPNPPSRPYEVIAPDGQISGIHPDMLMALARTFGLRLKPVVLPDWSSVLQAARERRVDIVMTIGVTTERLDYLAFTLGATPLAGALFAKTGALIKPESARFALVRNFVASDWVRRQYPQAATITVETPADALRAVGAGQADAYLGSLLEATDVLAREPVPGVEVNRLMNYGSGYYHFAVRKDWALLARILNKGIQSLRGHTPEALAAALGQLPPALQNSSPRVPQVLPVQGAEATLLAAHPVWRVGAVRGLALLNDVDERGLHTGIAAEYTEQVAQRLGVAVQMVPFDSVGAMLDGLRQGRIDLVPFLTQTPARDREFAFSTPYIEMPYTLVARSDQPHYWNLDSLRGKRLALQLQHPLRELLAAQYPDIRIVEAAAGTGAMDLVIERQAEAAVEVKLFANLRINGPGGERLRIVSEINELPAQFHFATTQAQATLLPLVNRALADIGTSERQRMLRRWVAVDLSPSFAWRQHLPALAVAAVSLLLLLGATGWWTHKLKREAAARRRSEELLHDIATTMPGLAFRYLLAADGKLLRNFYTPGALAMLGRELSDKLTVLAVIGPYLVPEDREKAWAEQLRCMNTGDRFQMTGRYQHPDGRLRWLHAESVQTRSPQGLAIWTGYVVDVTSERELQQRLAQEAESRSLMLASASHELRAPTHTLSLALQSLSTQGLNDEQTKAVAVAKDSARTLAELLNDVLDTARSGQDALQLRPRTFDLHQLLEDLARAWRAAARTKGLAFELQIAPGVPRTWNSDPLRLKQVLINLLSNACKYTQEGQVTLQAACAADGALRLAVADTGIGITPADQARLGVPYVTLDDPRAPAAAVGSSGLGLATSHRVAALLGGQLQLHSNPGQGTVASLTLPLQAQHRQPASSGTVLVCDDDETSRLLMGLMLRRHGFETQDAAQATQALALWRQGRARALVTDLDLPGMGGLELIRTVRAEEQQRSTRTSVIVCSGSPVPAADDSTERGLYDAYLVKPVNVATLADTLHKLGVVP